jgi:anti-anti-sigma factor
VTKNATVGAVISGTSPAIGETVAPRAGVAGTAPDFALAIERDARGPAVLVLAGELDLYRAPEVEDGLAQLIGTGPDGARAKDARRLAVDLRSVTFIDSTTLGLLLDATRRQQARRGTLLVLVGPQTPMRAFQATGFDRFLAIRLVNDDPGGRPA